VKFEIPNPKWRPTRMTSPNFLKRARRNSADCGEHGGR
jgi:hypothetical protein